MVDNHLFASCLARNHHQNGISHTSAQKTAFLSTQNKDLKSHPPYSPDLLLNDFFLFPYVQNKIRSQHFSTPKEAVDAFRMHVLEICTSIRVAKVLRQWVKRMQKYIDINGE